MQCVHTNRTALRLQTHTHTRTHFSDTQEHFDVALSVIKLLVSLQSICIVLHWIASHHKIGATIKNEVR